MRLLFRQGIFWGGILLVSGLLDVGSAYALERYQYDGAGRLVSVTYDDRSMLSYFYDAIGNILAVKVGFNLGKGDVNADGFVDLDDAVIILKNLAGDSGNLSPVAPYADTDGDGKINLQEVLYILRQMPTAK